MGEVYRARDKKLHRDVAIKVLLSAVAVDADRLARFTREAHVLASLNHPNIAHIYGIEDASGTVALVMELVEGDDLSQRVGGHPIPVNEALAIARQIADALEAAHDHGIIHRDLKPANIKLRSDDTVKVLDFGLAKAVDPAAGASETAMNSPTLSLHATQAGIVLGTAAYMSPEQARGRLVDRRTDIWALGCVLFEMLTGRRAFQGDDSTDTIVAVLSKEPDWQALAVSVPAGIRRLLRRCLEKDPRKRLDSAVAARLEIDEALTADVHDSRSAARTSSHAWWWAIGGAAVGALAAVLSLIDLRPAAPPAAVTQTFINLAPADYLRSVPLDDSLGEGRASRTAFAFSPDGRTLVFSAMAGARQQLYVRNLDQLEAKPLPETDDAMAPFFSPDGVWVGFHAGGQLKKIPLSGDAPPTVIGPAPQIFGVTWGRTGTIVFAVEKGALWRVPAGGGTPQMFTTIDSSKGEYAHRLPHFLPDGETIIFTTINTFLPRWDEARLAAVKLSTGKAHDLGLGADGRYVSSGHLVFMRSGTLVAAPFDASTAAIAGSAVTVLSDVAQSANMTNQAIDTGAGQFSVSDSGSLTYVRGGLFPDREVDVMTVSRQGIARPIGLPAKPYVAARLSPNETRLALWTQGLDRNVWTYDIERGSLQRLTRNGRNHRGIWTPDGSRVTYAGTVDSGTYNILWTLADGSGAPERLTSSPNTHSPSSWSPDGKVLALIEDPGGQSGRSISILSMDSGRTTKALMTESATNALTYPEFSTDGRWLAYVSNESGRDEVYVQAYPAGDMRTQISNQGGRSPAWSRNGRELYYATTGANGQARMMAVPITMSPKLVAGLPQRVFDGPYFIQNSTRGFDVTRDGQTFYMMQIKDRSPARTSQVILVQNWLDELKRRVPVP